MFSPRMKGGNLEFKRVVELKGSDSVFSERWAEAFPAVASLLDLGPYPFNPHPSPKPAAGLDNGRSATLPVLFL